MTRPKLGWLWAAVYILLLGAPLLALLRFSMTAGGGVSLANYEHVLGDPAWTGAFLNAGIAAGLGAFIAVAAATPAAYAFSRYRFFGDRQGFFLLFAARMTPVAALLGPAAGLYAAIGLKDSPVAVALAHCLVNVPIAIWIIEGAMSRIPVEIDEAADMDGHSFPGFFLVIFLPLVMRPAAAALFFCFFFTWTESALAGALMTGPAQPVAAKIAAGVAGEAPDWGLLAAAGMLTLLPGMAAVWFVRNWLARGLAMGRVS